MVDYNLLTTIVIAGVVVSAGISLWAGFGQVAQMKTLGDLIPIWRPGRARVRTATEFSSATVASSISLATVVMAYFELAAYLGVWLLWTVITTALGMLVVRLVARRIWSKLARYGDRIPTLHEFLGSEFGSSGLSLVGATATSLGFLGAFAVELTVGSRLFAGLVPSAPVTVVVVIFALIGLVYTSAGGFRAVVITDRIQMISIWIFLSSLFFYYAVFIFQHGGLDTATHRLPADALTLSDREGLVSFLIGIFIINVPTYIADMGMWQRVTSIQNPADSLPGLVKSAGGASISWGTLALLAIFAPSVASWTGTSNPLIPVLRSLVSPATTLGLGVLFICIAGLYAAMMSTASTQLIAVSHAVYEDIISRHAAAAPQERAESSAALSRARVVLIISASLAVIIVEALSRAGFSIADLVFAIYGAQLGLFMPVCLALFLSRDRLQLLSRWAMLAIAGGFIAGWGSALFGTLNHRPNWVFLAPGVSLVVSTFFLGAGWLLTKRNGDQSA